MATQTTTPVLSAHELASRIAPHLTSLSGWRAVRHPNQDESWARGHATLTRNSDGMEIGVAVGGYRTETKVVFRAHWPKFHDGTTYTPRNNFEITCSSGRDPKQLAREIERRLLVDFDPAYAEALAYVRSSDAAAGEAARVAERLAAALGSEAKADGRRDGAAIWADHEVYPGLWKVEVRPCSDGSPSVKFEVTTDEQTAARIFALLRKA